MAELLDLTVAEAAAAIAAGELSAERVRRGLARGRRRRRAATPTSGARDGRRRRRRVAVERAAAAAIPVAVKDIFCTEGVPTTAGSRILEGYRPPYTATAVRRLTEAGAPRARQDQHGRVRDGLLERELRLRAGAQPLGPRAASPAAPPAARPRPSPAASPPARSAPTPAARSASPPRSAGSSG